MQVIVQGIINGLVKGFVLASTPDVYAKQKMDIELYRQVSFRIVDGIVVLWVAGHPTITVPVIEKTGNALPGQMYKTIVDAGMYLYAAMSLFGIDISKQKEYFSHSDDIATIFGVARAMGEENFLALLSPFAPLLFTRHMMLLWDVLSQTNVEGVDAFRPAPHLRVIDCDEQSVLEIRRLPIGGGFIIASPDGLEKVARRMSEDDKHALLREWERNAESIVKECLGETD